MSQLYILVETNVRFNRKYITVSVLALSPLTLLTKEIGVCQSS